MPLRHEWKHPLCPADLPPLRANLRAVASPDPHGERYRVRSLYFDTPSDHALREKLDGVDRREKLRLRYYDGQPSFIRLEKKSKRGGLCGKQTAPLTPEETSALLEGDLAWMASDSRELVRELYRRTACQLLTPKTIVDYTREAFVFAPGNVRVTLDTGIRIGLGNFLEPEGVTIPAGDAPPLLEVKWDAFLPDIIRDAVQLRGRRTASFSKYAACRIYG